MNNNNTPSDCHLIILTHGLVGTSEHFDYIDETLLNHLTLNHPDKHFRTFKTKSNEKFKTYDGIDLCGSRVADEIIYETARLQQYENLKVTEISIIGYSLGGLITRFAIGILSYKKYFDSITPVNFVTFCSPHVGVLTPGTTLSIKSFNKFVPYLLGNSGKQIFLKDSIKFDNTNISLLELMANKNSIFYKGLQQFKYKSLYSNIRSDIRTSWWTSGISYINPFEILDKNQSVKIDDDGFINFPNDSKFELSFVENYGPVLLDVNKPIKFTGLIDYNIKSSSNFSTLNVNNDIEENEVKIFFQRKFKWLVLIFNTFIYIPMWVCWFLLMSMLQVSTSFIRVTKESAKLKDNFYIYQIIDQVTTTVSNTIPPLCSNPTTPVLEPCLSNTYVEELTKLENEVHDQGDVFLDSVFDAVTAPKDLNKSIFNQPLQGENILETSINKICSIPIDDIENWQKDYKVLGQTREEAFQYYQILKSFKMNMSPAQRTIVKTLNDLNWNKYPIYITKTNATHAAAIYRHNDKNFEEGKIVVEHFCEKVFKIN